MKTNVKNLLDSVIKSRNHTQAAVAKKAGWKGQSGLSTAINRDNISFDTIFRILDALEYDLVIQDRNSSDRWTIRKEEDDK